MRLIESIEDQMNGVRTYEMPDGQRVRIAEEVVCQYGAVAILRDMGYKFSTERAPVIQHGKRIGSVPGDFDHMHIKSKSPWYEPRTGDFVRRGDEWIAAETLGPGDLEAVPGFSYEVF